MTTREDLIKAICSDPFDTDGRLMFADWLEENGEPERAEFIRVQCELEEIRCTCRKNGTFLDSGPYGYGPRTFDACDRCGRYTLCRRERELLEGRAWGWAEFLGWGMSVTYNRGFIEVVECRLSDWVGETCGECNGHGGEKRRGRNVLPGGLWHTCHACHGTGRLGGHGAAIVACQPILEVRLTTLGEYQTNPLPDAIIAVMVAYMDADTDDMSMPECRSRALIDQARRQAGLPELDWTNRTIKELQNV